MGRDYGPYEPHEILVHMMASNMSRKTGTKPGTHPDRLHQDLEGSGGPLGDYSGKFSLKIRYCIRVVYC